MNDDPKSKEASRTEKISVRLHPEHKMLVEQAAEREGLQIASFIIMLFVRLRILPESCMAKIKRRPVALFNALHQLLGSVNKIGGNCKQLAVVYPDMDGLEKTQYSLLRASAFLTDAIQGAAMPEGINLYRLQENMTKIGIVFNRIVKSVNSGRPDLVDLPATFTGICKAADAITASLTGHPVADDDNLMDMAMSEMRAQMQKRHKDNV